MVPKKMVSCGDCLFVTSLQVGCVDLFLPFTCWHTEFVS